MKKVASYAEQVLNENYRRSVSKWEETNPECKPYTISAWCELESESDPDFFRWFFNDANINEIMQTLMIAAAA